MLTPTVHREDGWLLYSAPLPERFAGDREALLDALPAGCKFACSEDAALRMQAELPAPSDCAERVAAIEAGFAAAAARLGLGAAPALHAAVLPFAEAPDLVALCREVGWPLEERAGGSSAVDLGVQGAYLPASIEAHGDRVAVEVEIARLPEADGLCRAALVALLLRVNSAFRMVRAVLRGPEPKALLEVALPCTTDAAELGEALAALAVAARHCALEARLVAADEAIARAYLERSGIVPPVR